MEKEKETFCPIRVLGPVTNSMFTRWRRRSTTLRIVVVVGRERNCLIMVSWERKAKRESEKKKLIESRARLKKCV